MAARKGVFLGTEVTTASVVDYRTKETQKRDFNLATISSAFWGGKFNGYAELRPARDRYNFPRIDSAITYAANNNMSQVVHHLVWGNRDALPAWLKDGGFKPAELRQIVGEHFRTVCAHVRQKAGVSADLTWSVVNEYYGAPGNFWDANLGEDFVDEAFRLARDADPSARLMLNNAENHVPGPFADMDIPRVARLSKENLIDVYGMQMHLDAAKPINIDGFKRTVARFQALGVEVIVSEMDVDTTGVAGSEAAKDVRQAEVYQAYLEAFFAIGGKRVSFFGTNDSLSWLGTPARATLYDYINRPKPAFEAVQSVVEALPARP